jgi:hypothetical protein
VKKPKDVTPPTATAAPQPETAVKDSQPFARSEKAAEEAAGRHQEPTVAAPDQAKSAAEDELLGRALA